jgi:S-adenosylmethionine-diacylglycerol 3-amino-3-carboxypropyl transferase
MKEILYSQCWEDPIVLSKALKINLKDIVLSISSGGDNTLYLLSKSPKKIISIDINQKQNFLLELKSNSIKYLDYEKCLSFLGFLNDENRVSTYQKLREFLSRECRHYWDKNLRDVKKGVIHSGKFESYLRIFRNIILPISHSKKDRKRLLSLDRLSEQKNFYDSKWDSFLWRITFKVFFSKFLMKLLGRDIKFFEYNKNKSIAKHYLGKTEYGLTKIPIKSNYFLHYILFGEYNLGFLPEYMKEENFYKIRKNLSKLKIVTGEVKSYILKNKKIKFSKFNFSDVFEVYSQKEYECIIRDLASISNKGTIICYWNNLVERKFHGVKKWYPEDYKIKSLSKIDRVFFYNSLRIEKLM